MKTKIKINAIATALLIGFAAPANAAFTLQFGEQGFLGESGQGGNISWGLVFDTADDGFDNGSYTSLTLSNGATFGGSNDVFWFGGQTSSVLPGVIEGVLGNATNIDSTYTNTDFAIIWFESSLSLGDDATAGQVYGFQNDGFTSPADGATVNYDPATTGGNASIAFVPEPSAALLGAFGGLLLLRRRRSA